MLILSRQKFLIIAFSAFFLYFLAYKLSFLYATEHTTGRIVAYTDGRIKSPYVEMTVDDQRFVFKGDEGFDDDYHKEVPVIYKKDNPANAKIFTFMGFWWTGFLYSLLPLILFAAFVLSFVEKGEMLIVDYKRFFQKKEERAPFKFKMRIGEEEKNKSNLSR